MKKVFIVSFSLAASLIIAPHVNSQTIQHAGSQSSANHAGKSAVQIIKPLPSSQVCMINNKFMNKEQIKVPVGGKNYYGCCQGCVASLQNNASARTGTDPLTGESVDKASAFIVLKPGSKDDVLYFSSESNAKKYLKQGK